jgi:hypothetical protein
MTISTTTIKNSYSGNGSTTTFNYTFKITDQDDIDVIIRSASGTETIKTITTHYTVSGVGNSGGGSVVFTTGNIPASGETVLLRRSTPLTQGVDLIENDPLPANTLEDAFDKLTSINQELQEQADRSLKISRTNTMTSTEFTTSATDRANKVLSFDASGELSIAQELGTFKGNWSASTSYAVRDIVKDTSTNNIFIALTAHTSSGSQPLTTNTDSAKWSLLVDAASASSAQTAAAASATAAAASESAAATSETNAASSETNAAGSASTATTKASEASTSAAAALSSKNAAATSETNSASSATAAASSASAAAAAAGGGTVKVTTNDTTSENLNEKLGVSGGLTKTVTNAGSDETLTLGIVAGEVYGFTVADQDGDGIIDSVTVTTTNAGNDNINATTYAAFDDVVIAGSGISFSINASGNLIATI